MARAQGALRRAPGRGGRGLIARLTRRQGAQRSRDRFGLPSGGRPGLVALQPRLGPGLVLRRPTRRVPRTNARAPAGRGARSRSRRAAEGGAVAMADVSTDAESRRRAPDTTVAADGRVEAGGFVELDTTREEYVAPVDSIEIEVDTGDAGEVTRARIRF